MKFQIKIKNSTNCGCIRMKKMRNSVKKDETGKMRAPGLD